MTMMKMTKSDDVKRMLDEAMAVALTRRVTLEDDEQRYKSCDALCDQFVHACMSLAGGNPEMFKVIFKQHELKAMAVIAMVVEVTSLLPEGGVSTRDLWERAMKAVDER